MYSIVNITKLTPPIYANIFIIHICFIVNRINVNKPLLFKPLMNRTNVNNPLLFKHIA